MSFSTPAPKSKQKGYMTPYKTPSAAMYNAKAVDLVSSLRLILHDYVSSTILSYHLNIVCIGFSKM